MHGKNECKLIDQLNLRIMSQAEATHMVILAHASPLFATLVLASPLTARLSVFVVIILLSVLVLAGGVIATDAGLVVGRTASRE